MRTRLFSAITALPILLTCSYLAAGDSIESPLAVIVGSELEVDDLSYSDLKKILLGEKKYWSPRKPITILLQAPLTSKRNYLIGRHMGMTEQQFQQYWISKMFRAEIVAGPKVILSTEMAINLVTKISGSVAFLEYDEVPDSVKVLTIDGLRPGDLAYRLKP